MPKMRDLAKTKTAKKGWGRGSGARLHLKRLQSNALINKTF